MNLKRGAISVALFIATVLKLEGLHDAPTKNIVSFCSNINKKMMRSAYEFLIFLQILFLRKELKICKPILDLKNTKID